MSSYNGFTGESFNARHPENFFLHPSSSTSTLAAYGVLLLISLYYLLQYLESAYLPLSEILWNVFVYLTPSRMVSLIDSDFKCPKYDEYTGRKIIYFDPVQHAEKSNALRRSLGFNEQNSASQIQRSRRLSNLAPVFKPKEELPGLGNWDHSCYQNSVIQGLASLECLSEYLALGLDETIAPTTNALKELVDTLNTRQNCGQTFWTPAVLKSMSSWQQQDAQEYFSKIMNALEKDTLETSKRIPSSSGLRALSRDAPTTAALDKAATKTSHSALEDLSPELVRLRQIPSLARSVAGKNPLNGMLAQRVGCQDCGYVEGLSLVPFNCLTVPLGKRATYDISDCLDEYTTLEPISGVNCTMCTLQRARERMSDIVDRAVRLPPASESEKGAAAIDELLTSARDRLDSIEKALEESDVSDGVLRKCMITPKQHVISTKSRQAVIARPPKALAIHVNRSIFDEFTGEMRKNFAYVSFPSKLPLGPWCLGSQERTSSEEWETDPLKSMIPNFTHTRLKPWYELQAVIAHYGKHENGHYICYRRSPRAHRKGELLKGSDAEERPWWRLSDESVMKVKEEDVLGLGGVFMLFYEQVFDDSQRLPNLSDEIEIEATAEHPQHSIPDVPLRTDMDIPSANSEPDPTQRTPLPSLSDTRTPIAVTVPASQELPNSVQPPDGDSTLSDVTDLTSRLGSLSALNGPANIETAVEKMAPSITSSSTTSSQPEYAINRDMHAERVRPSGNDEPATTTPAVGETRPMSPRLTRTGRGTAGEGGQAMETMAGFVQAI